MNINEQSLMAWIMIDNEQEKEKAANQWLPYLVNAHAAAVWEQLLSENKFTNHKEQIQKSWDLVQRKAVTRLFAFGSFQETEAWSEYASYFLLSLQAVNMSLNIPGGSKKMAGWGYFSWGNIFNKHINETISNDEFIEALIKCYNKAVEIFKTVKGSEKAIADCEAALTKYISKRQPEDDGKIQKDLNDAHPQNKTTDIEKTILICEEALQQRPRDKFPLEWAMIHYYLGNAYRKRVKGDKEENLEREIEAFESFLLEITRKNMPHEWALTQKHLANAYNSRKKGDSSENIEKAIFAYELVLTEFTREKQPFEWAHTQSFLGHTYMVRIKGDLAGNQEKAIDAFKSALLEITFENHPEDWAFIQSYLGNVYMQRIRGEKEKNLEKAIESFKLSLQEYTREKSPDHWAFTQKYLGSAYSQRIKGDKEENLEKEISAYESALPEYTREKWPQDWAEIQNHLGITYSQGIKGELAENQEKAIVAMESALLVYTREESPYDWAKTQHNLGNTYTDRVKGDMAENLEKALAAYECALLVFTQEKFPHDWAVTQDGLGNVFNKRIKGNKAENLEKALTAFELSLTACTREKFPDDWAMTLVNLSNTYLERIKGDKAENIENAIIALESSLLEATREKHSMTWAMAQNNLGSAYNLRIQGDMAENLEKSIEYFESALLEYTRERLPYEWAMTQNNLGNAYKDRIKGDNAENLEKAISAYESALEERTREKLPYDWALTQNNLGNAYMDRIKGDRTENLQKAIAAFDSALLEHTRERMPFDWAIAQNNLGTAYSSEDKEGNKEENLEKSINSHELALLELTRENLPYHWAMAQSNLGSAYTKRIKGDKEENLEIAISCLELSFQEYAREKLPFEWARTNHNLGLTYLERIKGNESENIEKAISFFKKALQIYLPQTLPIDCSLSASSLGLLLYNNKRYKEAIVVLETGHEALENMRNETAVSSSKERIAADYNHMYDMLVHACLVEEEYSKAFEYVCAAKGRSMAEKLGNQKPEIHQLAMGNPELTEAWNNIEALWQEIEEIRIELMQILNDKTQYNVDNLFELSRAKLLGKLNDLTLIRKRKLEEFTFRFPMLAATLTLPPVSLSAVQKLAARLHSTIIEFYRHESGWVAFIITEDEVKCINLPGAADVAITEAVDWIQDYESGLPASYGSLSQDKVLQNLYQNIIEPLEEWLPKQSSLLVAPHRLLHYIPLGLAQDKNGLFLFEKYNLSFIGGTSSANALYQQVLREELIVDAKNEHLLMVVHSGQGPDKLKYAAQEATAVESIFKNRKLFHEEKATPQAVIEASRQNRFSALHFSCHGGFDPENPDLSGLMLQGTLTVEKILYEMRIQNRPLVVMSACQTGLSKVGGGDEFTGLNQALLQSGAGSIVSSLWSVNDKSTMLLMKAFYEERMKPGTTDVMALRKAMQAVSTMPDYKNAFFWGAFQVYGLPGNIDELFAEPLEFI